MHEFFKKIDVFSNISFDEEWHSYKLNGKRTVSVTKVTGAVKEPFDAVKKSKECVERMRREAEEAGQPIPTITPEELQDQWARKGLRRTQVHRNDHREQGAALSEGYR